MVTDTIMPPVHPGEILLTEFLEPLGASHYQLAKAVDVPARRINEIVHGQRRISAGTALRLARYLGTSERFWMNLQARYDLEVEKDRLGTALDEIRPSVPPVDAPWAIRYRNWPALDPEDVDYPTIAWSRRSLTQRRSRDHLGGMLTQCGRQPGQRSHPAACCGLAFEPGQRVWADTGQPG